VFEMKIMRYILLILIMSIGCGTKQQIPETAPLARGTTLPVADELSNLVIFESNEFVNWKLASPVKIYDKKSVFDYIDGAAELYFAYDFKAVATAEYKNVETSIVVDVYDMTTSENAFGIYSLNRHQDANYVNIGNEGILTGSALDFWKGKYFCKVYSFDPSEKYQNEVIKFGNSLASEIQEAGEEPSVLASLPQEGMIPKSAKFFSRKLGLDNIHFVSEENVFNLNGQTSGAVAEYQVNDTRFQLFIIKYPSSEKAGLAFEMYGNHLDEKGEPISLDKVYNRKSKMVKIDGKFTFVKVKDQILSGFWDVDTWELAKSALQFMVKFNHER